MLGSAYEARDILLASFFVVDKEWWGRQKQVQNEGPYHALTSMSGRPVLIFSKMNLPSHPLVAASSPGSGRSTSPLLRRAAESLPYL